MQAPTNPQGNPGYPLQGNPPAYPPQGSPGYPPQGNPGYPMAQLPPPIGPRQLRTTCRSCNAEILTSIKMKSSQKTHIIALLLCLMGCCLCMCIPYCMDSCLNVEHYCPQCNAYIGTYKR